VEEDRGAFKTNPRNPSQIKHFVISASPGNTRMAAGFVRHFGPIGGHFISRFPAHRWVQIAVFWIQPDSQRRTRLIQ
jgi:hypothetical protein